MWRLWLSAAEVVLSGALRRGETVADGAVARVIAVTSARTCERQACGRKPVATLTFVYADSTAVLGPLAFREEPYAYDLCAMHAQRLRAPRGWEVIRLQPETQPLQPSDEEIDALADQVRERGRHVANSRGAVWPASSGARYGHLRAVPSLDQS